MKKQFKITKEEFKVIGTYPAFEIGTDTDSDVLARMAGIAEGEGMAVYKIWFERKGVSYLCKIKYSSAGEQRFIISEDFDGRDSLEYRANNCSITTEPDVIKLTQLIKEGKLEFSSNSWYEGDITITTGERVILRGFESEQGLEGVHDSIQGIKDSSEDIKTTIEYLMKEHWEDPSNAEVFIENIKDV